MVKTFYLKVLKPHPKSLEIFGNPKDSPHYAEIRESIARHGLFEKLVINSDLFVLAGNLRLQCLLELFGPNHLVAVEERHFGSANEELTYLIECNVRRRPWSKSQLAAALKALVEKSPEQGGTKQPQGRPPKGSARGTLSGSGLKTDEEAAKLLGIGKHEARALLTIHGTEGVTPEMKAAVDSGEISPTRAARAIKSAVRAQGGRLDSPEAVHQELTKSRLEAEARPPSFNTEGLLAEIASISHVLNDAGVHGEVSMPQQVRSALADVLASMVAITSDSLRSAGLGDYAPEIRRIKQGWLIQDRPTR